VAFRVEQPERLQRYRFGHRITEFLVCAHCGVYVGAVTEIAGSLFAIVNTNALRAPPAGLKEPAPVNYDGESSQTRSERRRNRWTPCAAVAGG
jgi:hypothetical protein